MAIDPSKIKMDPKPPVKGKAKPEKLALPPPKKTKLDPAKVKGY